MYCSTVLELANAVARAVDTVIASKKTENARPSAEGWSGLVCKHPGSLFKERFASRFLVICDHSAAPRVLTDL